MNFCSEQQMIYIAIQALREGIVLVLQFRGERVEDDYFYEVTV